MFSEDNVDMIIEYVLDLSTAEMKTLKLLLKNNITPYKALEQVIDKREQKIEMYLRKAIIPWKNDALSKSYNICFITGLSRPDRMDVHHANDSFDNLMNRTFQELGINYRSTVKEYNPRELRILSSKILELHKGVQGIVLLQEVHQLFHKEYGMNNNSMQQIYDLKRRFECGEFKISV